jgi:glycosyltransferase involved in cell wall biosynthesis
MELSVDHQPRSTTATDAPPSGDASVQVLVFSGTYIPYAPSGVLRTVANTVDRLGDAIQFTIITRYLEEYADAGIQPNETRTVGHARVHYAAPDRLGWVSIASLINQFEYDVLWLNSCFTDFTVKPLVQRRLGRIDDTPVVLAPHGELLPQALQLKETKKKLYLSGARLGGLYDDLVWMATNRDEEDNIYDIFGETSTVRVAQNIPDRGLLAPPGTKTKEAGELSVIFLSRISRIKNLDKALQVLMRVKEAHVTFNIYGPVQDEDYWAACQRMIADLPANVEASYHGTIPYEEVTETLSRHDLFFLPTQSENYGYVILEALAASCPVLISDRTPWHTIPDEGAGWIAPLGDDTAFVEALREAAAMDGAAYASYRQSAHQLARERILDAQVVEEVRDLFITAAEDA